MKTVFTFISLLFVIFFTSPVFGESSSGRDGNWFHCICLVDVLQGSRDAEQRDWLQIGVIYENWRTDWNDGADSEDQWRWEEGLDEDGGYWNSTCVWKVCPDMYWSNCFPEKAKEIGE